jgi:hypothetical protein
MQSTAITEWTLQLLQKKTEFPPPSDPSALSRVWLPPFTMKSSIGRKAQPFRSQMKLVWHQGFSYWRKDVVQFGCENVERKCLRKQALSNGKDSKGTARNRGQNPQSPERKILTDL